MLKENTFNPNLAIHPGKTLQDILDTLNMTQVELANRTGLTPKTINEIIQGKNPITPDTSIKLSNVFGMSANFWNSLQRNYEETRVRLQVEANLEASLPALKKFKCYGELAKWKFVENTRNPKERVANLLNFFGVSDLKFIPEIHAVAFRKSKQKKILNESIAAWLRCGELEAQKIETKDFNKDLLVSSLENLRSLTVEETSSFKVKMVELCASFGIAVVFIPYFKNTYVNGVTKWLNPNKALIQLSLRGHYVDSFWFTFFHELGHILKHGKKEQFLELEDPVTSELKEQEANEFACNVLIPLDEYNKFISVKDFSIHSIKSFAEKVKISPNIVAGRLCFEGCQKWQNLSSVRDRIKFIES